MNRWVRASIVLFAASACVESQVVLSGGPDASRTDDAEDASAVDGESTDVCDGDACASEASADASKPDAKGDASNATCTNGQGCGPDEWCDVAQCGDGGQVGTCRPRPTSCNGVAPCLSQVCGCNGLTYCDPCLAQKAGTAVRSNGPC